MFFRRPRPQQTTFAERLEAARAAGFQVEQLPGARVRISREGFATVIEAGGSSRWVERPGIELDGGIGALVDHGYQKFWETPEGRRKPALSVELKALHRFQEDLREALGMISLY
ncbi:MAG: hypothetical protein FJW37_12605, partial [Acidobacteria bacterium]|nr:hypothetical protein [Acidobacteriota bacterium]